MDPYIEITRPNVCLLAALGFVVGASVAGTLGSPLLPYALLAAFFICAAGNTVNDYYDYDIDRVNAPQRPLPSGRMGRKTAFYYSLFLFLAGLLFSFLVGGPFFPLAIVNSLISFLYASSFKRVPLLGNIIVSFLSMSVYIAASLIGGAFQPRIQLLFLMSFFAMMSREMIKDVEDFEGDRKGGARKLPSVIGKKNSITLSRTLGGLASFLALLPYFLGLMGPLYILFAIPAVVLVIFSIRKDPKTAKKGLKAGMFLVLAGYLAGA